MSFVTDSELYTVIRRITPTIELVMSNATGFNYFRHQVGEEYIYKETIDLTAKDVVDNDLKFGQDLAAELGQIYENVKHTVWYRNRLTEKLNNEQNR